MDSKRYVSLFSLFVFQLLIINYLSPIVTSSSIDVPLSSDDGKVSLGLYYETLCPYCSNFIVNYLNKLFENKLISIVDLKLVPYGNARILSNNTIACQENVKEEEEARIGGLSMDSPLWKTFALVFYVLLLFCSVSASEICRSDAQKVELGLYYESLCPDSANFVNDNLVKVFEDDDLLSVLDVKLYPWGNAKMKDNTTFDCQHGPSECLLNTVEACAIDVWPEVSEHFRFIYCVENLVYEHKYSQWETCFEKLGLDPKPISDCYSSGYGTKLELRYAAETNALKPPHQYVPWVVVNGQPLYEDYENFMSYICKAYNGTAVPKACSNISIYTRTVSLRIKSVIISWMRKMTWAA